MKRNAKYYYNKLKATNIIANFLNLSSIQISNVLLLMLLIPIITRIIGIKEFGIIMFASKFSQLAGSVINYGTGQSGVRDVAFHIKDSKKLSPVFYSNLFIRVIIFALYIVLLVVLQWVKMDYYPYILFSIPIALAEVINPLCFFIGAERLKLFNLLNLLSNIATIIAVFIFIKSPADSIWVNFILGGANAITYLGLLIYFGRQYGLRFRFPSLNELINIGKDNFYLTVNNISVNLQQSIIIFVLPRWGLAALLGPYTLCDKIIGQCRILLITVSNAIYPNAARLFQQSTTLWNVYRKKTKYLLAGVFLAGSVVIITLADPIIFILSKEHNITAILILRVMALVPVMSALNVLNVLDLLLKNYTNFIFRIAVLLFIESVIVAFVLVNIGGALAIGSFTLIVETSAVLMYEYAIKKPYLQNA
ncbi:oligosaccharide flippase family protein [Mucilaginibacter sp. L3T2-6]|uniref:oligosaccharide flippase family protein n=1 Tax=Mucilaginibacter sp. L3T2-6 TaxID=3062491 RepID=UPI002675EC44|nr:oligosaccharide flippase family protein [Mucilaginibacter sp. L3T2-6]MDO3642700.1 oligosaccharide flippase family protein [Mucilaginibacter sp. L3T2-6]MDV6215349.1 oligosaccharide flippase family protein [Mucilaginibacter sp. L3T2-6]